MAPRRIKPNADNCSVSELGGAIRAAVSHRERDRLRAVKALGRFVLAARQSEDLTQDEYGHRFGISGPAIFKFEKGYSAPSLEMWIKIADRAGLSRRRAILMWTRAKLPAAYRSYIELTNGDEAETQAQAAVAQGRPVDYSKFELRDQMRRVIAQDKTLPKPLRDLLLDGEVWTLFKPTGHEINILRDRLAPLGHGSKTSYADALRLVREWTRTF